MPEIVCAHRRVDEGGQASQSPIVCEKRHRPYELGQEGREIVDELLAALDRPTLVAELRLEDIEEDPGDTRVGQQCSRKRKATRYDP
jgi:hypothetical protein